MSYNNDNKNDVISIGEHFKLTMSDWFLAKPLEENFTLVLGNNDGFRFKTDVIERTGCFEDEESLSNPKAIAEFFERIKTLEEILNEQKCEVDNEGDWYWVCREPKEKEDFRYYYLLYRGCDELIHIYGDTDIKKIIKNMKYCL